MTNESTRPADPSICAGEIDAKSEAQVLAGELRDGFGIEDDAFWPRERALRDAAAALIEKQERGASELGDQYQAALSQLKEAQDTIEQQEREKLFLARYLVDIFFVYDNHAPPVEEFTWDDCGDVEATAKELLCWAKRRMAVLAAEQAGGETDG